MSLNRLIIISLIFVSIPLTVLAQTAQPVVAPWSVDNTDAQSRIRQYESFKRLQGSETTTQNTQANETYEYTPPGQTRTQSIKRIPQTTLAVAPKAPSALEAMYSERIVDELKQFGYDLFGVPDENMRGMLDLLAAQGPSIPSGAVQDDFVLGEGDELTITFSGQRSDHTNIRVNSNGLLIIPDFPPIPASGRSIGQVRISLEAAAAQLHNTKVHISLASVRQIGVLVVGHVKRPGRQTLTVFHTVIDALMEAGGIDKTGSLRRIKLVRSGRSTFIDLYGLLMHGATNMDLQLRDGDRIIIPPIGPTAAIAGEVKRPGIYELLPEAPNIRKYPRPESGSEKLSLNEMLDLAGGVLAPGKIRYIKLGITNAGQEKIAEIHNAQTPQFSNGSILMVSKGRERRTASIELLGHTLRPGLYDLSHNKTLSQLLPNADLLGPDIYPLIGVIERWDQENLSRMLLDFPPKLVLSKKFDRKLKEGDIIHLFSNAQITALSEKPKTLLQPASLGSRAPTDDEAQELLEDEILSAFLTERSAFLRGAVRKPGHYPVAQGLSLDTVLATAGGLALEANTSNIELTSSHNGPSSYRQRINFRQDNPRDILVGPGDSVRVHGEVLSPANLQFREKKASLDYIHEAGGFTFHADKDRTFVIYPDGSAQPLQVSSWNYKPIKIPPGSTVVVPRDPKPFDFIQSAKDVSQILSNLAVTAIFIDDLQDD